MTSPTQRSLKFLRDQGYLVAVVEHWNHFARIRQDLFGIGDLLAVHPDDKPLLVQVTSTDVASRLRKVRAAPATPILLAAGWRIEVHGWRKLKGFRALQIRIEHVEEV